MVDTNNNVEGQVDLPDADDLAILDDKEVETPDDIKVPTPEPKKKDEPVEDDEELGDIEEDEKEDEEDKEDEVEEESEGDEKKPSWKAVREKYPNFFKEFPEVAASLGREGKYREIFPTVEEAREAVERVEFFNELENSIMDGSPKELLDNLAKTDQKALTKFAKNFLPAVKNGDEKLFLTIVTPYLKMALNNAKTAGESSNQKNLVLAVRWLSNYLFDSPDIPPEKEERGEEVNDEVVKLRAEITARDRKESISFLESVSKGNTEKLTRIIEKDVDPNKAYPTFFRNSLIETIIKEVRQTLTNDPEHKAVMSRLWEKTRKNGFRDEDRTELVNAYLGRAKKVLPAIRDKHKKEAMTHFPRSKENEPVKRTIPTGGKGAVTRMKETPNAEQVNWSKTSDEAFLAGKFVPRNK